MKKNQNGEPAGCSAAVSFARILIRSQRLPLCHCLPSITLLGVSPQIAACALLSWVSSPGFWIRYPTLPSPTVTAKHDNPGFVITTSTDKGFMTSCGAWRTSISRHRKGFETLEGRAHRISIQLRSHSDIVSVMHVTGCLAFTDSGSGVLATRQAVSSCAR